MSDQTVSILRAGVTELGLARALYREGALPDQASIESFLADPANYLLIANEGGRAIGSLYGYALRRPDRCEPQFLVYSIAVDRSHRRRGIGRALIDRFIAEARTAGAFEVWVVTNESNEAAKAMYSCAGFERQNPDDILLVLALR